MQEGGHFTMDFIEEEYRESVKMIMEILCVDIKQAYDLFMMSGCNVEAAIHMHTNPQPELYHEHQMRDVIPPARNRRNGTRSYQNYNEQLDRLIPHFDQDNEQDHYQSFPVARRRPFPSRVAEECEFDVKFNQFLEFKRKSTSFILQKREIIRQQLSNSPIVIIRLRVDINWSEDMYIFLINLSIVNKKPSKRQQQKKLLNLRPYINQIEDNVLQRRCFIKFGKGSMSESLQLSFDKKKPLLVFHLIFDGMNKQDRRKQETASLGSISVRQSVSPNKTRQQNGKNKKKKMVIQITDSQPQQKQEKPASLQQIKHHQQKLSPTKNHKQSSPSNINNTKNAYFKNLLMDAKMVKLINENFQSYIMDVDNYKYESYLRGYFEREDSNGSFLLVLRVNALEEIEEVGRVELGMVDGVVANGEELTQQTKKQKQKQNQSTFHNFTQKIRQQLNHLLQRIKTIQKEQLQLHQRYRLLKMGIDHFQYVKPPSTAQKIKIKQDRQIIRQQEEEFLNMQNDLLEQKLREEIDKMEKSEGGCHRKVSKEEVLKRRQQVRQSLTNYDSNNDTSNNSDPNTIMTIKFRLPNGKSLLLKVSTKQTPAYLFSYISSLQMDNIGFQQQQNGGYCQRQFDIIRPQDRMSLTQKISLSLDEIFEGSLMESLNVKEK